MGEAKGGKNELRSKAEAHLAETGEEALDKKLPEATRALVHELRAHQIELEMQNIELRQTEAELIEARNHYSDLYNFSPTGYLSLNHKLSIVQANLTIASMLGVEVVQLLSSPLSRFVCKEDQDTFYHLHRGVLDSGQQQSAELRLIKADGGEFWGRIEVSPERKSIHGSGRLLLTVSDITVQKASEQTLARERDRAGTYLNMAGTMLIALDRNQKVTLANKKACEILGCSEETIIGKNWFDHFVPQGFITELKRVFDRLMAGDIEPIEFYENPVLSKGGRTRLIAWHNSIVRDDEGHITGILTSGEDITERRAAEQRSFELIQALEQTGEGVIITDTEGVIEYVNRTFTLTTGYSPEEAIGNNPNMLHSGRQNAAFYQQMWSEILNHGQWWGKVWNQRKNGEVYPERLHINSIKDVNGETTHYCGIFLDITEQITLEEQMLQAQKMEAVGTLVGGIAHDFNNMLAAITAGLYLARMDAESLPEVGNRIEGVEKQCFRASSLISQLLTYARKGTTHLLPFDLTAFIKESFKLTRVSIPENIHLEHNICGEKLVINGDATQIQQILMNLLVNAKDAVAFAEQPLIKISLSHFEADDAFRHFHPDLDADAFARLSVVDNGYGIPKENIKHLFEPYFTTKEVGKGSGLGLAMVYGAVQTHHGVVEIDSRVNEGSGFHVYLPLHHGEEVVSGKEQQGTDSGQGETILLVDDESGVRETLATVLEALGYTVFQAANGVQALDLFKLQGSRINLLILDVVMPEMGGVEAARKIREINPDVPIIFSTGYDMQHLADSDCLPNSMILGKPTPIDKLSHTIRNMISPSTINPG